MATRTAAKRNQAEPIVQSTEAKLERAVRYKAFRASMVLEGLFAGYSEATIVAAKRCREMADRAEAGLSEQIDRALPLNLASRRLYAEGIRFVWRRVASGEDAASVAEELVGTWADDVVGSVDNGTSRSTCLVSNATDALYLEAKAGFVRRHSFRETNETINEIRAELAANAVAR